MLSSISAPFGARASKSIQNRSKNKIKHQTLPTYPQESTPGGPKTAPRHPPKGAPRSTHEAPKTLPRGPQRDPEPLKTSQSGPIRRRLPEALRGRISPLSNLLSKYAQSYSIHYTIMYWKFSRNHRKHPGTFQDQHIGASELPSLPASEPPSACRQAPRRNLQSANNYLTPSKASIPFIKDP